MNKIVTHFLSLLLCTSTIIAQDVNAQVSGCTDWMASNFDPTATVNDGSCIYPPTTYIPSLVSNLPEELSETSGLTFVNGVLYTHNDSGDEPRIYIISQETGAVLSSFIIDGVEAHDWESIHHDETHLYIGDIGNNNGNRTDLCILKVPFPSITSESVTAEKIFYTYADQTDFSSRYNNNDYDAEAFIVIEDSIYIFTKNWTDLKTKIYRLPKVAGTHVAELIGELNVEGLVTDAAFNPETKDIILLGYNYNAWGSYLSFAYVLFDYPEHNILSGNKRKFNLGNVLALGQNEGICWTDNYKGFISGEAIYSASLGINEPAKLSQFDLTYYLKKTTSVEDDIITQLQIYPSPMADYLIIEGITPHNISGAIYNILGQEIYTFNLSEKYMQIDVSHWSKGVYILKWNNGQALKLIKS